MQKLSGSLCFASHLRRSCEATEIMLRREEGKRGKPGALVIYLDRVEVDRLSDADADGAYRRCDEVAGYPLAEDRGFDLEASMSR